MLECGKQNTNLQILDYKIWKRIFTLIFYGVKFAKPKGKTTTFQTSWLLMYDKLPFDYFQIYMPTK